METIDIILIASAAIAALTKIFDVVSTIKYVSIDSETNLFGRWLFHKFGVKGGCWIVFFFEAFVIATIMETTIANGNIVEKIAFIAICLFILLPFHISTWLMNAKGKSTIFSRIGIQINLKVSKILNRRFRQH